MKQCLPIVKMTRESYGTEVIVIKDYATGQMNAMMFHIIMYIMISPAAWPPYSGRVYHHAPSSQGLGQGLGCHR